MDFLTPWSVHSNLIVKCIWARSEVKRTYSDQEVLKGGKIGRLKEEELLECCRGCAKNTECGRKLGYWEELQPLQVTRLSI